MSKLIWFMFLLFFASVFEESGQSNGVESVLDHLRRQANLIELMEIMEKLEYIFGVLHPNPNNIPEWSDLRDCNLQKLTNLCILTWHNSDVPEGHQRTCSFAITFKEYERVPVLVSNGDYIIDHLACNCSWGGKNGEHVDTHGNIFSITPYSDTSYFKLVQRDVRGIGVRYRIDDMIRKVPKFSNISEELFYYDNHMR